MNITHAACFGLGLIAGFLVSIVSLDHFYRNVIKEAVGEYYRQMVAHVKEGGNNDKKD